jgi:hypothetical protein
VRTLLNSVLLLAVIAASALDAFAIDAVKGKSYPLGKEHGPWMIMVASFKRPPEDRRTEEGLTARQAADELVYELRKVGIPAYIHLQEGRIEKMQTVDRLGREDGRIYAAQRGMISVLAGNYESVESPVAQKTLAYIKKFRPKFLEDPKNGGIYRETPGQKGPLSGAFLSINPLTDPTSLQQKRDPLLAKLNSGLHYGLIDAKGTSSLKIATFSGRQVSALGDDAVAKGAAKLDQALKPPKMFGGSGGSDLKMDLNMAGEDAEQLTLALRQKGIEAYCYHGRYESFVTVGAFQSKEDPRIQEFAKVFGGRMKVSPATGIESFTSETLVLPGAKPTDPPTKIFVFDADPKLIDIPRG